MGCALPNTVAAHPIVSSRSAETTPPWATFLYPLRWRGRITLPRTSFPSTKNRARTPERFSSPQRKHPEECGRYSCSGGSRCILTSYQRRAPRSSCCGGTPGSEFLTGVGRPQESEEGSLPCREGALRLRRRYTDALDMPFFIFLLSVACAAARRATGNRNGEPLT